MSTQDYLTLCNNFGVPEGDFAETFCKKCVTADCKRSLSNNVPTYEQRVTTWKERLFTQVPKLDKADPRFLPIAGQDFRERNLERWADPHSPASTQAQVPARFQVEAKPAELPLDLALTNTANPGAVTLPGGSPRPTQPTVVQPGAKIRLG